VRIETAEKVNDKLRAGLRVVESERKGGGNYQMDG